VATDEGAGDGVLEGSARQREHRPPPQVCILSTADRASMRCVFATFEEPAARFAWRRRESVETGLPLPSDDDAQWNPVLIEGVAGVGKLLADAGRIRGQETHRSLVRRIRAGRRPPRRRRC